MKKCRICNGKINNSKPAVLYVDKEGNYVEICENCEKQMDILVDSTDKSAIETSAIYLNSFINTVADQEVSSFLGKVISEKNKPLRKKKKEKKAKNKIKPVTIFAWAIVSVVGVIIAIIVIGAIVDAIKNNSSYIPTYTATSTEGSANSPIIAETQIPVQVYKPGLTMENFNRVQEGMSYSTVVDIFGKAGELLSSGGNIEIYSWSGDNGSAVITFENNKVASKSQHGLK